MKEKLLIVIISAVFFSMYGKMNSNDILKDEELVKFFSNKDKFNEKNGKFHKDYIKNSDRNYLTIGQKKDFELEFDLNIEKTKTCCFFFNIKRESKENYIRLMIYDFKQYLIFVENGKQIKKYFKNFKFGKDNNISLKVSNKNLTLKVNGKSIYSGKNKLDIYSNVSMQIHPVGGNIKISNVKYKDLMAQVKHKTITGSVLDDIVLYSPNTKNYVMDFGGNKSHIIIDSKKLHNLSEFTFEGWVNFREIKLYNSFIKFGPFRISQHKATENLFLRVPGKYKSFSEIQLTTDSWNHLACSFKNNIAKFYCNGLKVWEVEVEGEFVFKEYSLGKSGKKKISFVNAQMENVRIWTKALTEDEMKEVKVKNIKSAKGLLINNSFNKKLQDCKKYGDTKYKQENLPWENEY